MSDTSMVLAMAAASLVVPCLALLYAWWMGRRRPDMPELTTGRALFTVADVGCVLVLDGKRYRIAHYHAPNHVTLRATRR